MKVETTVIVADLVEGVAADRVSNQSSWNWIDTGNCGSPAGRSRERACMFLPQSVHVAGSLLFCYSVLPVTTQRNAMVSLLLQTAQTAHE